MKFLGRLAVFVAAVNVAVLAFLPSYELQLGPFHLPAHGLFKPLLYLGAAVLFATLAQSRKPAEEEARWIPPDWLIAAVAILIYLPTLFITINHHEWPHRPMSEAIRSLGDLARMFAERHPDGFYRPLTFFSLWLDYRIFGDHLWAYHLQNLVLHAANAVLVAKLARALNLGRTTAGFGALLFAAAPVNYEPVLWPGARFDLLATFFTLLALLSFLRYAKQNVTEGDLHPPWAMLLLFAAGVLSKESAYSFPLLVVFFLATRRMWGLPPLPPAHCTLVLSGVGAAAAILIGIRFAIYGGIAGYPEARGASPHFALGMHTFTSFFTRALTVPVFGVNTAAALGFWGTATVLGFALWSCGFVLGAGGSWRLHLHLLAAALLSAAPVANIVDWISADLHNTRYVY